MSLRIFRWFHQKGISRKKLKGSQLHRWIGDHFFTRDLWQFRRDPLAKAWLIGALVAASPFLGFQIATAILLCLVFRANVPLAFVLQWVSNPLTVPAYFPMAYYLGCSILGADPQSFTGWMGLLRHPMDGRLLMVFGPLLLGCLVVGIVVGLIGYTLIQWLWPHHTAPRKQVQGYAAMRDSERVPPPDGEEK